MIDIFSLGKYTCSKLSPKLRPITAFLGEKLKDIIVCEFLYHIKLMFRVLSHFPSTSELSHKGNDYC